MAINDLGIVRPGSTLQIPFATYTSDDPAKSVTTTELDVGAIQIYKNGSLTQRASTTGYGVDIDVDGVVGVHWITIDLASNATADFFNAGSRYTIIVDGLVVDAATAMATPLATFTIGYPGAIHETNIATLASQVSFTIDEGSADDDAYNGCVVYIHDIESAVQVCFGYVSDYDETAGTLTVTLKADPGIFTIAAGDNISFFPPANVQAVAGTTQTALVINDILTDTAVIGALGAGLTDLGGMSTGMKGEVNTEVDTALSDINLDHFVGTPTGIPALPAGTYLDLLQDDGTAVYSRTTDSMQAIRDHATTIKSETALIVADTGTDGVIVASVNTDAIDADALSTLAVDEIADGILGRTMTEGYAADGSTATVAQMFYMLWQAIHEFSIATTVITGKKLDSSNGMTWTLDDATNPTSRTRAS